MVEGIENIESSRFPGVPSKEEEEKIFEAWVEKMFPELWACTNHQRLIAWVRKSGMAAKVVKE